MVCACSVFSSSWCLGRAAVCGCGTPWTFLFPFFRIPRQAGTFFQLCVIPLLRLSCRKAPRGGIDLLYLNIRLEKKKNFKKLLVRNHLMDINIIWQKFWSPSTKMVQAIMPCKMAAGGGGRGGGLVALFACLSI